MKDMLSAWPLMRRDEVPLLLGKRILLCGFSGVTPLLPQAGLALEHCGDFRMACAEASLSATPARPDPAVGALVHDLHGIAAQGLEAVKALPDGETIQHWLLSPDGGWGGGDPRGFWRDAIAWAGRSHPPFDPVDDQRRILSFCVPARQAMSDPAWRATVDRALSAPQDAIDARITARQGYHLLTGSAVGGDINQIAMILGPMRDWAILRRAWADADGLTRAAMARLGPTFLADQRRIGLVSRRIDEAWLAAPENNPEAVFADA